jgi:hypothetical protein
MLIADNTCMVVMADRLRPVSRTRLWPNGRGRKFVSLAEDSSMNCWPASPSFSTLSSAIVDFLEPDRRGVSLQHGGDRRLHGPWCC